MFSNVFSRIVRSPIWSRSADGLEQNKPLPFHVSYRLALSPTAGFRFNRSLTQSHSDPGRAGAGKPGWPAILKFVLDSGVECGPPGESERLERRNDPGTSSGDPMYR